MFPLSIPTNKQQTKNESTNDTHLQRYIAWAWYKKNRAACFVKAFLTGQIREKNHFHMISDTGRDEKWSARTLQEFYNEVPNSELYEPEFGVPSAVESRSQVSRIFSCVFGKARPGISHFKQSSFAGRNSFQMFCDEQNPIDKHSLIHPFIILSIHLSIRSASLHAQMVW